MQFEPEPEAETEAWQPAEPVMMAGEVVRVEAEAESEPVGASEVVPEVVEGEEDVVTEPAVASETMEREAPAEGSTRGSVEATGKGKNRPPSPAPADLLNLSDPLVNTDDISGDYSTSCFGWLCTSMTVEPLGGDLIEVRKSHWFCLPPLCIGPSVDGDVWIRNPNTNAFRRLEDRNLENHDPHNISGATFSADGTATARLCFQDVSYQKKAVSQKRTFQKVDTGDLAGTWCSCIYTPCVPLWFLLGCLCTTKKALHQDQYEESGCGCHLFPPFIALPRRDDPGRAGPSTRTRFYANGHPTNGFYDGINQLSAQLNFIRWYSDASCGYGGLGVFSKKLW